MKHCRKKYDTNHNDIYIQCCIADRALNTLIYDFIFHTSIYLMYTCSTCHMK